MIEVTITFGRPNHVYGKSLVADKAMKLLVLQKGSQRFFTLHFEIEIETPVFIKHLYSHHVNCNRQIIYTDLIWPFYNFDDAIIC